MSYWQLHNLSLPVYTNYQYPANFYFVYILCIVYTMKLYTSLLSCITATTARHIYSVIEIGDTIYYHTTHFFWNKTFQVRRNS